MKLLELPDVVGAQLVGKNGLVYEDCLLYRAGCEIHLLDDGKTIKVTPLSSAPVVDMATA